MRWMNGNTVKRSLSNSRTSLRLLHHLLPLLPPTHFRVPPTTQSNSSSQAGAPKRSHEPYATSPSTHSSFPPLSQTVMQVYFEKKFKEIDWDGRNPPSSAAERLAELSNGLPVWGATVCAILSSDSFNRPPAYVLLEEILASGSRVSADKRLWTLYHTGLSGLLTPDSNTEEDRETLMKVLSHMFVLQESASVSAFANLVQLPEMTVRRVHERLQALQTRGAFSKDTIEPMSSRFHASFMDFLTARPVTPSPRLETTSPHSSSDSNSNSPVATSFRLDVAEAHRRAAERCLALVIQVGTSDSSLSTTGTQLPRRGLHRYAIKYWPYHVANGTDRFQPLPDTLEVLVNQLTPTAAEWWMEKLVQEKVVAQTVDYVESDNEEEESEEGEPDDAVDDDAQVVVDRLAEVADMANDKYSIGDPGWWWWNVHCLEVAVRIQVHKPDVDNWVDLGWCYANAHQSTASSKYLDDALAIFQHAVGMKRSWRTLDSLGQTLSSIFEDRNDMNALEESISLHRESLSDTSSLKCSEHVTSLVNLGTALQWRFDRLGRSEDLDSAIQLYRQSLTLVADDDPEKPISIINLGNALCARFVRQSIVEDLDEAIRLLRYGLEICQSDEGGDTKPRLLTNLVQILRFSYYKRGNAGDLEEAIRINREALTLDRGQGRRHSLICLAGCLTAWFEHSGDLQDIDEAIRISREALAMCPGKHSERYGALLDLGSCLKARFLAQGGTEELEEAVLVNREALELCAGNHSFRYLALTNLSITLRLRFDLLGDGDDLYEAISLASEALRLCPRPHSGRSSTLVALAEAFQTRFIQEASEEDIEHAIALGRDALELRLGADPERWEALTSLARALEMRFAHQNGEGKDDDREEAISLNREAVALCPHPHPGRWRTLTNLASSLLQGRDEVGLLLERVEESVNLNREALSLCHRHHPYRCVVLANLARALRRRYQLTQSSEDIREATDCYETALELCSTGHRMREALLKELEEIGIQP
ncbi:mucin-like protein 1 [Coprinopsis cinerea AmutBmut pab1-1]|nr:mucin-like protein 1 [Coprinopsis cinerea AmutBmut pab1-1]